MKLKIGKEFEVDVDRIRSLSREGNTIKIETFDARYEITDTSQEVSNGDEVEDLPKQNPTKPIQPQSKSSFPMKTEKELWKMK